MKENSDSVFDRVLHSVGDDGKFQKRFNIIFNFGVSLTGTMVYINLVLALAIPEHWCYVPGRDEANKTIQEWKNITLPKEKDSAGLPTTSSCKMYNDTYTTIEYSETDIISCQHGFEYSKEWYSSTVPSTNDWVCEKELHISNLLAAAKIGEVAGCLVIGYLGDVIGRRPMFIIALILSVFGRLASVFVVDYYIPFIIFSIIAVLPSTTGSQACQVILMEISPMEDRATIAEFLNIGWSIGLSMLPLIYWVCRDWTYFIIVTTIPLALYFPLIYYMIESPRWLLSRGRVADCIKELSKISKVNGTKLSPDVSIKLHNINIQPEKVYGIYSLFSSLRLAKNTVLLVICWIANLLIYNLILLGVSNISGNPFINFFLQSIAEIPSYTVGKILCSRFGRRIAGVIGYFIVILFTAAFTIIMGNFNLSWLQIVLIVIVKFAIAMTYYIISLQSIEIYPTCVRQTGFTFGLISGNVLSTAFPYIIYLGTNYNAYIPYIIIMTLGLMSLTSQIFLPETLNEKLPETLNEASVFGTNQSYWSIPRKRKEVYMMANIKTVEKSGNDVSDVE